RAPLGAHHQSRAGGLLALEVRPRNGHSEHAAARAPAADRAPARPRTTHAYSRAAPDPWQTRIRTIPSALRARSSAVAMQHLEQRLCAEVERCDRNPLVRGVHRLLAEAAWQPQR